MVSVNQGIVSSIYVLIIALAAYLGVRSAHALVSLRGENRKVREFFDEELVRDIRKSIEGEVERIKEGEKRDETAADKDPLSGLLLDIYDDLYDRMAEEEKARKKELENLKAEIKELREEIRKRK